MFATLSLNVDVVYMCNSAKNNFFQVQPLNLKTPLLYYEVLNMICAFIKIK